jgi:hypothetical protein
MKILEGVIGGRRLKAQFWSFDAIFAIVIFSASITILAFAWTTVNNQLALSYSDGPLIMQIQEQTLAQTLLSPGSPANWQSVVNTTNPSTWSGIGVGLGNSTHGSSLSMQKIYTLMAMGNYNYQATKQGLGVGYEYFITVYNSGFNVTMGSNPNTGNAVTVYVGEESVDVGGIPSIMKVELWTPQPLAIT